MNESNTLLESVVNSINDIDRVCMDANINVTNSLIDLYIKEAEMIKYGALNNKEVIQENWLDYEEGESIIKTLFLYIPRLIMRLFNEIKDFFVRHSRKHKEIELKKKKDALIADITDENLEYFYNLMKHIPNIEYDTDELKAYYLSSIKSYQMVLGYIGMLDQCFDTYAAELSAVEIDDINSPSVNLFADIEFAYNKTVDSEGFNKGGTKSKHLIHPDNTIGDVISEIEKEYFKTNKKIQESMASVQRIYKSLSKASVKVNNAALATAGERVLKDFRAIYTSIQDRFNIITEDIVTYSMALTHLQEAFADFKKHNKEAQKKKDMIEMGIDLDKEEDKD